MPFFISAQEKVDINNATIEELQTITGIGPVYAQRIIDNRPFSSLDDLIKIKGIGEKTLQKIKDQDLACVETITQETSLPQIEPGSEEVIIEEIPEPILQIYPKNISFIELVPSPEGPDDENEYFKIFNNNDFAVDLSGWIIKDGIGKTTEYILNTKISALSELILKRPDTKITLNNDGDELILLNPNKEIIDSVEFAKAIQGEKYIKENNVWAWTTAPKESIPKEPSQQVSETIATNANIKTIPLKRTDSSPIIPALAVALLSAIGFLIVKSNLKTFWY